MRPATKETLQLLALTFALVAIGLAFLSSLPTSAPEPEPAAAEEPFFVDQGEGEQEDSGSTGARALAPAPVEEPKAVAKPVAPAACPSCQPPTYYRSRFRR